MLSRETKTSVDSISSHRLVHRHFILLDTCCAFLFCWLWFPCASLCFHPQLCTYVAVVISQLQRTLMVRTFRHRNFSLKRMFYLPFICIMVERVTCWIFNAYGLQTGQNARVFLDIFCFKSSNQANTAENSNNCIHVAGLA